MVNGIINVYKESGYTSHDVVAKLRKIIHQKKIGHTGTLDPDAIGVLPVCLGRGTKLCDMLTDKDKVYEAVMLLGTTTDTQDITGTILTKKNVTIDKNEAVEAIESFVGEYNQIPPMYSALKVNGKKLYELARAGVEVERKPRLVTIKSISINKINFGNSESTITFTVECTKGTYIRTLCQDIGEKLGCGACMKSLKRTRVSQFQLEDSLTLDQIDALVKNGNLLDYVIPVDGMFPNYKKIVICREYNKLIYNGNSIFAEYAKSIDDVIIDSEMVRIYDEDSAFIGIYRLEGNIFKPVKMFYDAEINS